MPQEVTLLQTFLWSRPTNYPVLRCDHKAIYFTSFCDLAEERYIDSFIDVCIGKYIKEGMIHCTFQLDFSSGWKWMIEHLNMGSKQRVISLEY